MSSPRKRQGFVVYFLLTILSVFISGCVTLPDPEVSQEFHSDIVGVLNSSHTLGQTIKIRRSGFNGINIWSSVNIDASNPNINTDHYLHLDIYAYPEPLSFIHHSSIKLSNSTDSQSINFSFPAQIDSAGRTYLIQLSTDAGSINIYGRNEDISPLGNALADSQPFDVDLSFSTSYEYGLPALVDDVNQWLTYISIIPALIMVLFLPGWLLLKIFIKQSFFDFGQSIAISIGLSLAVIPIVLLWTSTIGIYWTKPTVLFLSGFLVSLWVFLQIKSQKYKNIIDRLRIWLRQTRDPGSKNQTHSLLSNLSRFTPPVLLIAIFLLSLSVRMIMIRDLATPAWVDSIHHAMITRIILETGAFPNTYLPYLDLESNFYHSGFHSQLATFQLLTNLDLPKAMLIFGQVLNASMILVVYAITKSLTLSNIAALFAALITGLFTPMPAYYTSWGRYTQLSGLLILPIAYLLFMDAKSHSNKYTTQYHSLILAAIAACGLFLVHYRVTVFFVLLIISELLFMFIFIEHYQITKRGRIVQLLIYSSLCILMMLPWIIQAIPDTFIPNLTRPIPDEAKWFSDFSWRYLSAGLGKQALVLASLGFLWGIIQKKHFAYLLMIWIGLLLLLANLSVMRLPGGGLFNTTSIEISLFIPISIFGGFFLNELINVWKAITPNRIYPLFILGILLSSIFMAFAAAKYITPILNPVTFLSRFADMPAMQWIEEKIPANEVIVINPFLWGYGLYAGSDGGSWITPLAGRKTIPPPVLYTLAPEEDRELINQISQFVIDHGENAGELHNFLTSKDIHYIYLGSRGGPLSPQALIRHSGFELLYEYEGVRIFVILP